MRKNYIKEIIETFLGNEMPQEVQQAFGDWLRDPEARTEKEQTLETYWERLEAGRAARAATGSWPRLHEAIRREESFRRPEPLAKGRGGSGGRTAGRGRQLLRRTGLPAQQGTDQHRHLGPRQRRVRITRRHPHLAQRRQRAALLR